MRPLLYVCAPVRTATKAEQAHVLEIRQKAFDLGWAPVWGLALFSGLREAAEETEADREKILSADSSVMLACADLVIAADRLTAGMEYELLRWLPNPIIPEAALDTPDSTVRVLFEPGSLMSVLGQFEKEIGLKLACKSDYQK